MATKNGLILIKGSGDKVLTPAQKTFNKLVERVEKLKKLLEKDKESLEFLFGLHMANIPHLDKEIAERKLEIAGLISKATEKWKFKKSDLENIREIVIMLCDHAFQFIEPDAEQQAIFNKWSQTSYQQEVDEQKLGLAEMIAAQLSGMFGIELDPAEMDLDDPEFMGKLQEKIGRQPESGSGVHGDGVKTAGSQRRKGRKELEREERSRQLEEQKHKSLRSIYLSLVKVLHPDRSTDEEDRQHKEELIKKVTSAYENKDLPSLLRLETEWLSGEIGSIEKLSEDKLSIYISSLREQVKEIEARRWGQKMDPKYEAVYEFCGISKKKARDHFAEQERHMLFILAGIREDVEFLAQNPSKDAVLEVVEMILDGVGGDYEEDLYDDFLW